MPSVGPKTRQVGVSWTPLERVFNKMVCLAQSLYARARIGIVSNTPKWTHFGPPGSTISIIPQISATVILSACAHVCIVYGVYSALWDAECGGSGVLSLGPKMVHFGCKHLFRVVQYRYVDSFIHT